MTGSVTATGPISAGGSIVAGNTVESNFGGFKFPDATVQTTAADKVYTTFPFSVSKSQRRVRLRLLLSLRFRPAATW